MGWPMDTNTAVQQRNQQVGRQGFFRDISEWIYPNPPASHYGVAVSDVDGDGRFEVLIARFDGANRLLRWTGTHLRDVAPPAFADEEVASLAIAAADADGDGQEEIYVHNCEQYSGSKRTPDRLWDVQPDGIWEDWFARPEHTHLHNRWAGRSVAVIDRRGVGRYGYVVASYGKPLRLYEWTAQDVLADLAPSLGLAMVSGGRGLLTLPVVSDWPDIICVNEHGPNWVYCNQGDGTFRECAAALGLDDPTEHGRGVVACDVGGYLGLCWGNWEGPHRLMIRQSDGRWKNCATAGFAFPARVRNVIAADFDNDGYLEIFLHNHGEANRLYRLYPPAQEGKPPEVVMLDVGAAADPHGCGTGAAVVDIDGDGQLELLVTRGEQVRQPLGLYKAAAGERNGYLRIRPLTRFQAPARGAVVRAVINGRLHIRGICGGSGYLGQMEPVAHFGLGPDGRAERVEVVWPDGVAVVLLNPPVGRTITVPYPLG
ncbi:MAG: CRTAC1 family protein [Gemmataceae bacterium]|nr:CRTAC1 family protein [Gemmataceae bacterium]